VDVLILMDEEEKGRCGRCLHYGSVPPNRRTLDRIVEERDMYGKNCHFDPSAIYDILLDICWLCLATNPLDGSMIKWLSYFVW
jgi:hypothetical protein